MILNNVAVTPVGEVAIFQRESDENSLSIEVKWYHSALKDKTLLYTETVVNALKERIAFLEKEREQSKALSEAILSERTDRTSDVIELQSKLDEWEAKTEFVQEDLLGLFSNCVGMHRADALQKAFTDLIGKLVKVNRSKKLYICTGFRGHYPVGTAAIVLASHPKEAANLLEAALKEQGVAQSISVAELAEAFLHVSSALILNNGDY